MPDRPFLLSGAIGMAVIVVGIIVVIVGPGRSDELAQGFYTPVIAFEFATESDDVFRIFADEQSTRGVYL